MQTDLDKLSDKQLAALEKAILKEQTKRSAKAKREATKAIKAVAEKHGFSINELIGENGKAPVKKSTKRKDTQSAPKYANPKDKTQTWTGKGRQPAWFKNAMEQGVPPEKLEI